MDFISAVLSNLLLFEIVTDLFAVTLGAGLCFGALKWRRGLLTGTAIGWGLVLGVLMAVVVGELLGGVGALVCILAGVIGLPILTYRVPAVNRFVLGFLVCSKLLFMVTTVMMKGGALPIDLALAAPLIIGAVAGLVLAAWTGMAVSSFVLACSFIGASGIAPVVAKWVNRILFSATGDMGFLIDPLDILFALFRIELTDLPTLICMVGFMAWGVYRQIRQLQENKIPLDTPVISTEYNKRNGKLCIKSKTADTARK